MVKYLHINNDQVELQYSCLFYYTIVRPVKVGTNN